VGLPGVRNGSMSYSTPPSKRLPPASLLQQIAELHQQLDEANAANESLQGLIKSLLRTNFELTADLQSARSAIVFLSKGRAVDLERLRAEADNERDAAAQIDKLASVSKSNRDRTGDNGDEASTENSLSQSDSEQRLSDQEIPVRIPSQPSVNGHDDNDSLPKSTRDATDADDENSVDSDAQDRFDEYVAKIQREDLLERLDELAGAAGSGAAHAPKVKSDKPRSTRKTARDLFRPSEEQFATLDALQEELRSSEKSFVDREMKADEDRRTRERTLLAHTESTPPAHRVHLDDSPLGAHSTTSLGRGGSYMTRHAAGKPPKVHTKPRRPEAPLDRNRGMVREIFKYYLDAFDKSFLHSPRSKKKSRPSKSSSSGRNHKTRMTFDQLRIFAVNFRIVPKLLTRADLEQWWRLMGEPPLLNLEQFTGFLRWTAVRAYNNVQCPENELRELALLQWITGTQGYQDLLDGRSTVNLQKLQLKLDGLDLGDSNGLPGTDF